MALCSRLTNRLSRQIYTNLFRHSSSSQEFPSEADIVVVGGGSIGCSVFYHLTKLGVKNCVLLERDRLTSGTTWHTAGLHWHLRPNDVEIDILKYTRELISTILPEETGLDAGWINNGGLFIAVTKERMDEYKRLMTVGKAFGINSYTLSPKETKEIYPLLNVDDIYGALFSPGDGLIDPSQWTSALTKGGTMRGGRVFEKTPVTNVLTSETDSYGYRKVTGLETPRGTIKTPMVVNCAGAWGPKLAAMVGVDAPTIAYRHAYVITEGIEGIRNMPNVRDHDGAFYLRLQGDSLQVGGYEFNPDLAGDKGSLPDDFSFGLYNVNWDVCFGGIIDAAVQRLPILGNTGIKSEICGPLSFTPDDKPLVGEPAGLKGFFMSCGYDLGMMMGGGAGREVAKWIVNGRPDRALYGWDVRRFNPKVTKDATWLRERTHERFATMYKMVIPKDEPLSGRNILKTPFHDQLLAEGAFFQERHSWERAGWFSPDKIPSPLLPYDYYGAYGVEKHKNYLYEQRLEMDYSLDWPKNFDIIKNEALACRNQVVGFDMSYFGKFYISGPDAQAAVDYIFSADMRKPMGQTVYSCMLNDQGRVEADLTVSVVGSGIGSPVNPTLEMDQGKPSHRGCGFYVAAGGGSATHDWVHIQDAIQEKGFDVKLQNVTEELGILSVQGPNSRSLLEVLIADTDFSNAEFPFSTNKLATLAGHQVRLIRLSFVGEMGWEIHAPKEACPDIYSALKEAGAEKYGFRPAGYRALEPLSAEKGYRFWDSDLRLDDTPLEAGLAFTCKLKTDVEFKGRAAIEKQKAEGIRKRIVCILLDDQVPLFGLETLFRDGEPVGYTRRGEYAFMLNKPIAYAYVSRPDGEPIKTDWIKSGNYTLEALGKQYPAKVSLKPPFDPEGKRLQGKY